MVERVSESKSIVVIGRRWRDRVNGNTYHSAQVIVDGETVHRSGVEYGDFEDTAAAWLESNGYISPRPRYASGSYSVHMAEHCGASGIVYTSEAIDVPRKGDLAS